MKPMTDMAHAFLAPAIHKSALCVDATLGNGHDARFFLDRHAKCVHAFEIQEDVLRKTQESIQDARLICHLAGHEHMQDYVKQADAVIFNFGFCPGRQKDVMTRADTSLEAVQQALTLLRPKGRMALVFYPHDMGREEADVIMEYLKTLDHRQFPVLRMQLENCENACWCVCIEKRKG
jgi:reverse gyrase